MSDSVSSSGNQRRTLSGAPRTSRGWTWCACIATAVGLMCALFQWGWAAPAGGMLLLGMCGAATAASWFWVPGQPNASRIAWIAFVTAVAPTAAVGLVVALGSTGLLVVLLLVGTSPAARAATRLLVRAVTDTPDSVPSDLPAPRPPAPRPPMLRDVDASGGETWSLDWLSSLDDDSVCLVWRQSFLLLEAAQTLEDRMAVVRIRERCLDELQRRCPRGVETWLASGARAPGNPRPFLRNRPHRSAKPDEEGRTR